MIIHFQQIAWETVKKLYNNIKSIKRWLQETSNRDDAINEGWEEYRNGNETEQFFEDITKFYTESDKKLEEIDVSDSDSDSDDINVESDDDFEFEVYESEGESSSWYKKTRYARRGE